MKLIGWFWINIQYQPIVREIGFTTNLKKPIYENDL